MDEELPGQMAENNDAAQDAGVETLIDLLTGAAIRSTPKCSRLPKSADKWCRSGLDVICEGRPSTH